MKVFAYEDGTACGYYRIRLPFDAMKSHGLDASYATLGEAPPGSIIVGQRVGSPGLSVPWLKLWRDHRIVWETDDDLWAVNALNRRAVRHFTPEVLDALEQVARIAHMVTVSTEPLADVMRRFNDHVVVLPNHVDDRLLDIERPRRDRVTVGWAGGDSHHVDWLHVAPTVRRFIARNPSVDLHTIGANYQIAARIPKAQSRHTGWSANLFDYYRSIDFDIGIAPLAPIEFNRSKSHIKALEYAALGIPVIASDREPYRDFVVDGVTGFLVRHPHEWERRLRDLVNDEAMRTEMGAAAKRRAHQFAIGKGWSLWADAYRSLS